MLMLMLMLPLAGTPCLPPPLRPYGPAPLCTWVRARRMLDSTLVLLLIHNRLAWLYICFCNLLLLLTTILY